MASLLSMGGGAAEGLDIFLERLLKQQAEDRASRQLMELSRHNQAEEGIQGRIADTSERYRTDSVAETGRRNKALETDRAMDNLRATMDQRPIGAPVGGQQYESEMERGADPSLYDVKDKGYAEPDQNRLEGFVGPRQEERPAMIGFRGTQKSITDKERADKMGQTNGQQKKYKLDGQMIDATYEPKTQRVMYRGEDVTDRVEAYEKPGQPYALPTMDLQGNPTVEFVNRTPGVSHAARPPQQVLTRMYSARGVVTHMDDVMGEIQEADRRGLIGPIAGRFSEFMAGKVGSTGNAEDDQLMGQLRMDLKLLTSGTVMTHFQSRGGQGMLENFQKGLDSGKMSADQLLGSIKTIRNWLETYAKNPADIGRDKPEGAAGGDPYEDYLRRTKKK